MKYLAIAASLLVTGCTTIHFDNGPAKPVGVTTEQWHHVVAMDLVEVSQPVNLDNACMGKEWVTVKSEKSLVNGLAGGAVNNVGPIWYPKTATISCAE